MKEETKTPKLVGNKSSGYNYKYTSLGDLVLAGVDLPPMRVAVLVDGEQTPVLDKNGSPIEYIEAYVESFNGLKEWIRGARIVVPSGNKMNEAQAYGSALTYARRYTALTVLGIACDDDNKIEVRNKDEADAQLFDNMKKELADLWNKAGGKPEEFEKYFEEKTKDGFDSKIYTKLKTSFLKRINEGAEK